MTRTFCDCCGNEITGKNHSGTGPLHILCHLLEKQNLSQMKVKIIDGKEYAMSGRADSIEMCLPCYNLVAGAAAEKFLNLKTEILCKK